MAGAAERLYLSQPAMSRTLGRIRRATGDQILVRTGRWMTPTPYAVSVQAEVHALLQRAQAVLAPGRELDLDALERTFSLRCHDAVTTAISPGLISTVRSQAPSVRLRFLAEASTDTNDMRQGRLDLEVGSTEPVLSEIRSETVGQDHLVAAMCPDHPYAQEELTIKRYARAHHITVSRRGRLHDPIDDALEKYGLQRQVVATAPTSTAALHSVSQSDLIVAVPECMCQPTVQALGLRTLPIPLELQPVPLIQSWHQRYEGDPAHTWLRDQVRKALEKAYSPDG